MATVVHTQSPLGLLGQSLGSIGTGMLEQQRFDQQQQLARQQLDQREQERKDRLRIALGGQELAQQKFQSQQEKDADDSLSNYIDELNDILFTTHKNTPERQFRAAILGLKHQNKMSPDMMQDLISRDKLRTQEEMQAIAQGKSVGDAVAARQVLLNKPDVSPTSAGDIPDELLSVGEVKEQVNQWREDRIAQSDREEALLMMNANIPQNVDMITALFSDFDTMLESGTDGLKKIVLRGKEYGMDENLRVKIEKHLDQVAFDANVARLAKTNLGRLHIPISKIETSPALDASLYPRWRGDKKMSDSQLIKAIEKNHKKFELEGRFGEITDAPAKPSRQDGGTEALPSLPSETPAWYKNLSPSDRAAIDKRIKNGYTYEEIERELRAAGAI